jgi:hypothetical protein
MKKKTRYDMLSWMTLPRFNIVRSYGLHQNMSSDSDFQTRSSQKQSNMPACYSDSGRYQ